jgi:hypothetical protein
LFRQFYWARLNLLCHPPTPQKNPTPWKTYMQQIFSTKLKFGLHMIKFKSKFMTIIKYIFKYLTN